MKIKFIILNLTIFLLCFKKILNGCKYIKEKDSTDILDTDIDDYLGNKEGDEARQSCFSLSNSYVQTDVCCYNKDTNKCVSKTEIWTDCPEISSEIFNNCGMAGIYQPITNEICTEISLVQGHCCFVKTESGATACIRTKELNKDKTKATNEIIDYVNKHNNNSIIKSVQCDGGYLKYYYLMLILFLILIK